MTTPLFSDAVLYSPRAELRDAIKQELKVRGVKNTTVADHADGCMEALFKLPAALLVLDWECGAEDAVKILASCRGRFKIETRAIFLVAAQINEQIIATGAEYAVSQIHTGEISRAKIKDCLEAIYADESAAGSLKADLVAVADARNRKDMALALQLLEQLNLKYVGNPRVAVELAEALMQTQNWNGAMEVMAPLVKQYPNDIRALHTYGRCLLKAKRFAEACGVLESAKLLNPFNVDRLVDLGIALLGIDRVEEAKENFDEALRLDKESKEAAVGKGQCLLLEGEINEALMLIKQVADNKELASIFNTAAIVSVRKGRFQAGINLYHAALKAINRDDQVSARLLFNMGIGYFRWQKPDKARECFEKAVKLDPSYEKAKFNARVAGQATAQGSAQPAKKAAAPSEGRASEVKGDAKPTSSLKDISFDDGFEAEFEDESLAS